MLKISMGQMKKLAMVSYTGIISFKSLELIIKRLRGIFSLWQLPSMYYLFAAEIPFISL